MLGGGHGIIGGDEGRKLVIVRRRASGKEEVVVQSRPGAPY